MLAGARPGHRAGARRRTGMVLAVILRVRVLNLQAPLLKPQGNQVDARRSSPRSPRRSAQAYRNGPRGNSPGARAQLASRTLRTSIFFFKFQRLWEFERFRASHFGHLIERADVKG
jgi:hypothetical protein